MIDFQTEPGQYKHWNLSFDGAVAFLTMDVNEQAGLAPGYELKMNSYDLGVDIELYDAVQRLRFEHPEIKSVVIGSMKERIFCAGANIRMLGSSSHQHKVNFCKFTNETRNGIEDASKYSGQKYICAINGTAAGGGYELALATDYIVLVDDGNASVSLPEVPLLAVLPGTGGLTRLVDKRKVRRDLADVFCTVEEGVRGQRAVDWRLVDEIVSKTLFDARIVEKAQEFAVESDRPSSAKGVVLQTLQRVFTEDGVDYSHLKLTVDRLKSTATLSINASGGPAEGGVSQAEEEGVDFWVLALAREMDDALLHLRANEPEIGTLLIKSQGNIDWVLAYDHLIQEHKDHWLIREIMHYWKRILKRIDVTSRSVFVLIEPGSCFVGFLAELLFAADRSYMLEGQFEDDDTAAPRIQLSDLNFIDLPMANGWSRLKTRFYGEPESVDKAKAAIGQPLEARQALQLGLITYAPDDIDWQDEIRLLIEERSSFSPDSLTGLEANLRFAGPETVETKIFGRLSAWQNWIFQRPNAVGEDGALKLYGTGVRPNFDKNRV